MALAGLTGNGTVNEGDFDETFQLAQGYFPASYATGTTSGTFTLTEDYTPDAPPPPPPRGSPAYYGLRATPELSSFTYLLTALLLATPGLYRWAKKNA
jgi:hypothetical protein